MKRTVKLKRINATVEIATDDKWDGVDAKVDEIMPDNGVDDCAVVARLVTLYNDELILKLSKLAWSIVPKLDSTTLIL